MTFSFYLGSIKLRFHASKLASNRERENKKQLRGREGWVGYGERSLGCEESQPAVLLNSFDLHISIKFHIRTPAIFWTAPAPWPTRPTALSPHHIT